MKNITIPNIGKTEIDVLLKDGTIIEAKRFNFSKYPPGSQEYEDLKNNLGDKIAIWKRYSPTCAKKVIFKETVADEMKEWLENVKRVIVEVMP